MYWLAALVVFPVFLHQYLLWSYRAESQPRWKTAAILFCIGIFAWPVTTGIATFESGVFVAMLLALAIIDSWTQYLPDGFTIPLALIGLALKVLDPAFVPTAASFFWLFFPWMAAYSTFWTVNFVHKITMGRDGLGMGDAKLLAAIAVWVGLFPTALVVFIAAAIGVAHHLMSYCITKENRYLPFGPGIVAGALFVYVVCPNWSIYQFASYL